MFQPSPACPLEGDERDERDTSTPRISVTPQLRDRLHRSHDKSVDLYGDGASIFRNVDP
jgi:hypothetical protein